MVYTVENPAPLTLVDGSYGALTGSTMAEMFQRLEDLHREIPGARMHMAWVPEQYLQHAHLEGVAAEAWPKELLQDLPGLALNAAGHVHRGWFKIAEPAEARGIPWRGALTYRANERLDDNPLKLMLLIAIALGLTVESSRHAPVLPRARLMVHGHG